MIGFSWAMFIAGVPSIVVSQWKVESAGTRDLMVNFHRGLLSPKSKPTKTEALRQAALKLLMIRTPKRAIPSTGPASSSSATAVASSHRLHR